MASSWRGILLALTCLGGGSPLLAAQKAASGSSVAAPAQPAYLEADRISGQNDREMVAEGHVHLRKEINMLFADRLVYREDESEVEATGNVRLTQEGAVITGPHLKLKMDEHIGFFDAPKYSIKRAMPGTPAGRETTGSGEARRLDFEGKNHYRLTDATYSTCGPSDPAWFARAEDMTLDYVTETGIARDATLHFKDVPLLYSPWLTFSLNNRRKSGFLAPTLGTTSKSGLEFTVPYFINIAPDMDATVAPRVMTKRGVALTGEFRYLDFNHNGRLQGEWLPKDNATGMQRSSVSYTHNQNFGMGISGNLNLNRVSDDTYFSDLSSRITHIAQNNLLREGSLRYASTWWSASIMAQSFQTLQDPALPPVAVPYRRLPQVSLNATRADLPFGATLTMRGEYVHFAHPTQIEGSRTTLHPQISFPLQTPAFYITPSLALHSTSYHLERQTPGTADRFTRNVPLFSVDSGLVFERPLMFNEREMTQTLEPRLYYLRVPTRPQQQLPVFDSGVADFNFAQIFSDNRYTGGDRISDANQLTAAVTSRLVDPQSGAELLRGAVGQRYYFKDQEVTLPGESPRTSKTADFLAALNGSLGHGVFLDAGLQYNPREGQMERFSAGARYNPSLGKTLSASYRTNRNQIGTVNGIKQIDLAGQWPIWQGWTGVARYNYSLADRRLIEAVGGLEYNADCWASRVVLQRIATATGDSSTAFFIQLELNGFSSIGSNPLDMLKRSIPGYSRLQQPAADPVFGSH